MKTKFTLLDYFIYAGMGAFYSLSMILFILKLKGFYSEIFLSLFYVLFLYWLRNSQNLVKGLRKIPVLISILSSGIFALMWIKLNG